MLLELQGIERAFNGRPVLRGISFGVAAGEIVVLLGPSGCGKTTLLRIVAGLETADSGRVLLDGGDLAHTPVHRRGFGFVFQDFALFPHKDVGENVAFGLRMLFHRRDAEYAGGYGLGAAPSQRFLHLQGKQRRVEIERRVAEVLNLVGLPGFAGRPAHELSGGEQQRVALARSLAPAPRLLLLDEPLGSLDAALRERLMGELRTILKQAGGAMGRPEGITAIYVTHDQREAFAIADRVLVMNEGRIEQEGRPAELFQRPRTPFVARFLGMENLWPGRIVATEPLVVRTELGDWLVEEPAAGRGVGEAVTLLARPDAGRLAQGDEAGPNLLEGRLVEVSFRGRYQLITLAVASPAAERPLTLKLEVEYKETLPSIGQTVRLWLDPAGLVLL